MKLDLSTLSAEARIQIWREAISHLRYLNDEVWKRFQFFLAVDVALVIALLYILDHRSSGFLAMVAPLSLAGFLLTVTARYILKRNRIYYLQMLAKKTLLEKEIGFYEMKLGETDIDLAFPWRLTPEIFPTLQNQMEEWTAQNIDAPNTIARRLFRVYDGAMIIFAAFLLLGILFLA